MQAHKSFLLGVRVVVQIEDIIGDLAVRPAMAVLFKDRVRAARSSLIDFTIEDRIVGGTFDVPIAIRALCG